MFNQSCNRCQKFIVKGANFCWYCGCQIGHNGRFETALSTADDMRLDAPKPKYATLRDNWQIVATRYGATYLTSSLALWLFGAANPLGFATLPTLGMVIIPPFVEAVAEWRRTAPPKADEPTQAETLRIETVTQGDYGPELRFEDAPEGLLRSDLAAVFRLVATPPLGKGENFSRRKCKSVGISEGKYTKLQDFFRVGGYAYYPEGKKQSGLIFTRAGKLLLARAASPTP